MTYVCFDIGGTAVKHALLQKNGRIVSRDTYPTPLKTETAFVQQLVQVVKNYEKTAEIEGIGLSFPGFIDPQTGTALTAGAVYPLYGSNIKKILAEFFPYPIAVENDANCAALAEKHSGNAKEISDFILITLGTGIGGAIFLNDQLVRGKTFRAGEFGMMRVDKTTFPDRSLHDLASTSALIKNYRTLKKMLAHEQIDGRSVFAEMKTDKEVHRIVDEWSGYVSTGIFNAATFLNPEKILIGGGISANPKLLPLIHKKLNEIPEWQDFCVPVETAKYKNDSGIIGALFCILDEIKK